MDYESPRNDNPLLDLDGPTRFTAIRAAHVLPAVEAILQWARGEVERVAAADEPAAWETFGAPLEHVKERVHRVWSPVSHLHSVMDSEELRAAYESALPLLSDFHTGLSQDPRLFRRYRELAAREDLDALHRRLVEEILLDFRLGGVELPDSGKARFREIQKELSQLATRFEQNVMDATDGWRLHVDEESAVASLPESVREQARAAAAREGLEGWVFTLHAPSWIPFMTYCADRELRREMYTAYVTRASDQGPDAGRWDNAPVIDRILRLREESAKLLGYDDYAALTLQRRMVKEVPRVLGFLRELAVRARPAAERELADVTAFARERGHAGELEPWDLPFHAEQLREARFSLSQEALRPYFPLPRVLDGMFALAQRLFGVECVRVPVQEPWHDDVRQFEIRGPEGEVRGRFYVDLHARPRKRGGAWMDGLVVRRRLGSALQRPVACLVGNFTPAGDGAPALLTHDEVTTLFHEFGHALHHLLTVVDEPAFAGVHGVRWDAVELPSQLMENWCWEPAVLALVSGHWRTGEPLPEDWQQRLRRSRTFHAGLQTLRQIEFALFDMLLHAGYDPDSPGDVQGLLDAVREEVAVIRPPAFNRFQNSFSHIFAGGYAAGYYSYKWAEVLSADAFSLFAERGVLDGETGRRFRETILERGGAEEPMDLYVRFRGREPRLEPLLEQSGLAC